MNTTTSISLDPTGQIATLTSGTKCLNVQIQSPSTAVFTIKTVNTVVYKTDPVSPSLTESIDALTGQIEDLNVSKLWINYTIPVGSNQTTMVTVAMCPYVSGIRHRHQPP